MNIVPLEEPTIVYPEAEFEAVLSRFVTDSLCAADSTAVVPKFGLDLGVFFKVGGDPRSFFIEAKSYGGQRQGGVGFGNGRGEGPQVGLLLCNPPQLAVLDSCIRWAFADATQGVGTARYALLTCTQARGAAMGIVARGKQNNFRLSALEPHFVTWPSLCSKLATFLGGPCSEPNK